MLCIIVLRRWNFHEDTLNKIQIANSFFFYCLNYLIFLYHWWKHQSCNYLTSFINLQIREYHKRHPSGRLVDANEDYEARLKEEPVIAFSGEVGFCLTFYCCFLLTHFLTVCKPLFYCQYLNLLVCYAGRQWSVLGLAWYV